MGANFFHLNMKVFGGGNATRNALFRNALNAIGLQYDVAGYTELRNATTAVADLNTIVNTQGLRMLGAPILYISASGNTEYVGLAISKNVLISSVGRTFFSPSNPRQPIVDEINVTDTRGRGVSAGSSDPFWQSERWRTWVTYPYGDRYWQEKNLIILDRRGVVYMRGQYLTFGRPTPLTIGFVHNVYNLPGRDAFMQILPTIATMISGGASNDVIIGGDFNIEPLDRRATSGTALYAYSSGIPTTLGGRIYDYWFTNRSKSARGPHPQTFVQPLIAQPIDHTGNRQAASDHAAIVLRYI